MHLGQVAALHVQANRGFSIGSAGRALVFVGQRDQGGETVYLYRAAEVGRQTLAATPADPGTNGCVSCVTVHYFAEVVQ